MKILVAHNYYQQAGGEDVCVAAEIAMLRANGHEVIPYFLHNDAIKAMSRARVAAGTIWSRPAYRELRGLLRTHRPQIVHFHNTFPLMSPAAYYAARAEGVGVVQTLHNFRLLCANALFFREGKVCEDCLGKSVPWPGVVRKCYRTSSTASATVAATMATHRILGTWKKAVDVYIALNAFSRQKFIEGGLPENKIVVKPNFVYPDPQSGRGMGGYAVFVGRLSQEKGVETLLNAWTRLSRTLPLRIVGDGTLSALVKDAEARDPRIQWLGSRAIESVYELIGEAMFLILPSRCYEQFPRTIIEAFAKGTPVIASDLGAMAGIMKHHRTGLLFKPGDAADLAAKVEYLLDASDERESMRQAVRQEYEVQYTAESNYRILMNVYDKVLADKVRREQIAH